MDLTPLVWVVDDSPTEVEAIRRALAVACRVEVSSNGEVLLEALQQQGLPDVVVLDWHLPGLSGIEVCRYLRGSPSTATLPILLITGNTRPEDVEEGLLAGALPCCCLGRPDPGAGGPLVATRDGWVRSPCHAHLRLALPSSPARRPARTHMPADARL